MQKTEIFQPNITFLLPSLLTVKTYEFSNEHDYVLIRVRPHKDVEDGVLVVAPLMRDNINKDDVWRIWEVVIENPALSQGELDYLRQNNALSNDAFERIWKSTAQDLTVRRVRQNLSSQAELIAGNENPDFRFLDFSRLLQKFYLQLSLKANPIDWERPAKGEMNKKTRKKTKNKE